LRRVRALEVERERERLEILKQPVRVELTKKRQKEEEARKKAWGLFEKVLDEARDRYLKYWDVTRKRRFFRCTDLNNDDNGWLVYEGKGKWSTYERAYLSRAEANKDGRPTDDRNVASSSLPLQFPHPLSTSGPPRLPVQVQPPLQIPSPLLGPDRTFQSPAAMHLAPLPRQSDIHIVSDCWTYR
jgi:hypothetical protein